MNPDQFQQQALAWIGAIGAVITATSYLAVKAAGAIATIQERVKQATTDIQQMKGDITKIALATPPGPTQPIPVPSFLAPPTCKNSLQVQPPPIPLANPDPEVVKPPTI